MAQIIRVFPTPGAAQAACDELTRSGFTSVETVEVPDRRERGSRDNSAVVRVEAPFLTALKATAILERNGGKEARGPGSARCARSLATLSMSSFARSSSMALCSL